MTTDKPSAGELADAIEAKLKDPCGEYIISALEGSIIVPALRRPPVAGAEVRLTEGQKDTLRRIANAKAAGINLHPFWHEVEQQFSKPASVAGAEVGVDPEAAAIEIVHQAREVYENHTGDGAWIAMEAAYVKLIRASLSPPVAERGGGGAHTSQDDLVEAAKALVEEISTRGTHERWKRLDNALYALSSTAHSPTPETGDGS